MGYIVQTGIANRWKLVDYHDVWGNEDDGYWVNDLSVVFEDLYMTDDVTDNEIYDYLKDEIGYPRLQDVNFEDINFDGDDFYIELTTEKEYGIYPLCRLERTV